MQIEKIDFKWYSHTDHLRNMMTDMLTSATLTDVTLVSDDQMLMKAHRVVLGACSPIFKTIIENINNSEPVIFLRGIQHEELQSVLEFMYLGETTVDKNKMEEFLKVSKSLEITELMSGLNMNLNESVTIKKEENDVVESSEIIPKVKAKITKNENENSFENEPVKTTKTEKFKDGSLKNMSECTECKKLFHHVSNRNRHIRTCHQGVRSYICNQCHFKTNQSHNLKRHIETQHCKSKVKFSLNLPPI